MPETAVVTQTTRLRHLREKRGLRQKDLARLAGVGLRTIVAAEHMEYKPSRKTLRKLCNVFNIPFTDRETLLELVGPAAPIPVTEEESCVSSS